MLVRLAPSLTTVNTKIAQFSTKLFNGTTKKDLSLAKHLIFLKKARPAIVAAKTADGLAGSGQVMQCQQLMMRLRHHVIARWQTTYCFSTGNFGIMAKKSRLHGDYIQAIGAHIELNVLIIQVFCRLGFAG